MRSAVEMHDILLNKKRPAEEFSAGHVILE